MHTSIRVLLSYFPNDCPSSSSHGSQADKVMDAGVNIGHGRRELDVADSNSRSTDLRLLLAIKTTSTTARKQASEQAYLGSAPSSAPPSATPPGRRTFELVYCTISVRLAFDESRTPAVAAWTRLQVSELLKAQWREWDDGTGRVTLGSLTDGGERRGGERTRALMGAMVKGSAHTSPVLLIVPAKLHLTPSSSDKNESAEKEKEKEEEKGRSMGGRARSFDVCYDSEIARQVAVVEFEGGEMQNLHDAMVVEFTAEERGLSFCGSALNAKEPPGAALMSFASRALGIAGLAGDLREYHLPATATLPQSPSTISSLLHRNSEPITDEPITDEPITAEPITDETMKKEPMSEFALAVFGGSVPIAVGMLSERRGPALRPSSLSPPGPPSLPPEPLATTAPPNPLAESVAADSDSVSDSNPVFGFDSEGSHDPSHAAVPVETGQATQAKQAAAGATASGATSGGFLRSRFLPATFSLPFSAGSSLFSRAASPQSAMKPLHTSPLYLFKVRADLLGKGFGNHMVVRKEVCHYGGRHCGGGQSGIVACLDSLSRLYVVELTSLRVLLWLKGYRHCTFGFAHFNLSTADSTEGTTSRCLLFAYVERGNFVHIFDPRRQQGQPLATLVLPATARAVYASPAGTGLYVFHQSESEEAEKKEGGGAGVPADESAGDKALTTTPSHLQLITSICIGEGDLPQPQLGEQPKSSKSEKDIKPKKCVDE